MRILVVDDSKVARAVLAKLLKEIGYDDVAEAADGVEALERLDREPHDLVITDWNMPNLDGMGLVRAMQESDESDVPVLVVSSESYFNRIVEVMRAGAEGYIRKPFTAETLQAKITEVLKKREMSGAGSATLAGRLDEIGFPELVQFLTSCRRNGRLVIKVGDRTGTVELRDGEARAAAWGELEGDDAVFAIAEFDQGSFKFQPGTAAIEPNISMPTMPLLIEAMKKRDEKAAV
ncbi:MAG: response regulator [Planctomycetota bacterium]|jgi:two-component system chemotaxis response regulator CheY